MLNRDCNLTFGQLLFPYLKLGISILFIVSFFSCVRIFQYFNYISCVLMVTSASVSLLLLFLNSIIMSNMYDTSKDFSQNLFPYICNMSNIKSKKVLETMLKSCDVIRVQVGSLYHMEAKAKLTMLSNIVSGVVFLLVNVKI